MDRFGHYKRFIQSMKTIPPNTCVATCIAESRFHFYKASDLQRKGRHMSDTYPFDVFLSHNAQDKPLVRALAERLRMDGVKVWFDEWQIPYGAPILHSIDQGLAQSRLMLLFMSQHAFGSDWVTLEQTSFRHPDVLNREQRCIPLRLDEVTAPPTLRALRFFDWRKPDEALYRELLALCLVRPPAPPHTPPTSLDFAALATNWPQSQPETRPALQLDLLNARHQIIQHARCAAAGQALETGDRFLLRVTCHQSGQLALFYQSADGAIAQLFPNRASTRHTLAAGTWWLPGELLPLPYAPLGPERLHLYFQNPGLETIIGLWCPQLPATLPTPPDPLDPLAPLPSVDAAQLWASLNLLRQAPAAAHSELALCQIRIEPAPALQAYQTEAKTSD
jgi:hypothetical protein